MSSPRSIGKCDRAVIKASLTVAFTERDAGGNHALNKTKYVVGAALKLAKPLDAL
jgi:hypothetical protein